MYLNGLYFDRLYFAIASHPFDEYESSFFNNKVEVLLLKNIISQHEGYVRQKNVLAFN